MKPRMREENAEEEDFAAEPGAPPHLECAPRVGGAAEMEDGDVEGDAGDAEQGS